ncbi:MAG TPA: hypothetical protein VHC98_01260 [Candidatus Saccharimonadales bacterium]|nr:hypothetical protein [Candidatus Saccharimonadales bacterium]
MRRVRVIRVVALSVVAVLVVAGALVLYQRRAGASYTCLNGGDHGGASWDPATDCPGGIAGVHTNVGTLTIGTGETATVQAYNGSSYGSVEIDATSISIVGTLTADAKGYRGGSSGTPTAEGPGAGWSGTNNAGGAGYGGFGGNPAGHAGSGAVYGSIFSPTNMGSGGGYDNNGNPAGNGGGAIKLVTSGTLTVSGTVTAAGGSPSGCNVAGGSGGSIWAIAGTLAGAGTVTVAGGNGATGCGGAAGGGGRISLNSTNAPTFSGTVSAAPGATHNGTAAGYGTAYILRTGTNDLTIPAINGTWRSTDETAFSYHDVTVNANVTFSSASAAAFTLTVSDALTLASGVTLSAGGSNTTSTNGTGVTITVGGNVTVPATSAISADGLGYPGGTTTSINGVGPGGGAGGVNTSKGGAYGGIGGNGNSSTYGSASSPLDLGSGGGSDSNGPGTAGGGAIKLVVNGTLTVNGSLTANGTNASGCNASAGSGGSLYLDVNTFTGSGSMSANGGNGATGCGGAAGGGGRIAIRYLTNSWTGNTLDAAHAALAGTNHLGAAAGNGTVVLIPEYHAQATGRSVTMTTSTPGAANVSYEVVFTPTINTPIGGIVVDMCDNDPVFNDAACTYPASFDWGGASPSLTVNGGMGSGWTAAGVQGGAAAGKSQVLELSNATPQTVSTGTPIDFTITTATNPAAANHSFYARVITFNTAGNMTGEYTVSGTTRSGNLADSVDHGGMALSTGDGIALTFVVPEAITFCVSGGSISANCTGLSPASLTLGHGSPPVLNSSSVDTADAYTQTSTNAGSGVTVRMVRVGASCGGLSSNGGSSCGVPAINTSCGGSCSATTLSAGTAAVGVCVQAGSGSITVQAPYNGASCGSGTAYGLDDATATGVRSAYGSPVFTSSGALDNENDIVTFAASASSTTPAGIYIGAYSLVATGTF